MFIKFDTGTSLWNRGEFDKLTNLTLNNPWDTGRANTPFDQLFYLSLSVAVGGTNGFFPDVAGKPWGNDDSFAAEEFYSAVDTWYPTWGAGDSRGMTVQSVKMEALGKCRGE